MKDKLTGKSRGFGFVTFLTAKISNDLLTKDHTIDGKEVVSTLLCLTSLKVDCKRAIPKEQIPNASNTSYRTKKLFVGGLPHNITKEIFYNYFKTYGPIIDYVLINDKDTGRSRGFGFITYEEESSLQQVIKEFNNHLILGKWVECKPAVPKQNKFQVAGQGFEGDCVQSDEEVFYYDEYETYGSASPELTFAQSRRHSTQLDGEHLSLFTYNPRKTTSIQGCSLFPDLKDDMWEKYINGPEEREICPDVKEVSEEDFIRITRSALWDESPRIKGSCSVSTKENESSFDFEESSTRTKDFGKHIYNTPSPVTKARSHSQSIFHSE
eukprot:TRINITY_DN837_c0_g1_i9.p1 TRINITY_DN837_c0_g1~~TRINITY_DN837_c0_g1_i9.p1  ORF type:complete len:325 (-),score=62.47 TRINITY_DN837_c0_g1_i9:142-1116(-)